MIRFGKSCIPFEGLVRIPAVFGCRRFWTMTFAIMGRLALANLCSSSGWLRQPFWSEVLSQP